nr:hypothetical protein CFP56_10440 [Quercus suber]
MFENYYDSGYSYKGHTLRSSLMPVSRPLFASERRAEVRRSPQLYVWSSFASYENRFSSHVAQDLGFSQRKTCHAGPLVTFEMGHRSPWAIWMSTDLWDFFSKLQPFAVCFKADKACRTLLDSPESWSPFDIQPICAILCRRLGMRGELILPLVHHAACRNDTPDDVEGYPSAISV